jgi:hypothetical protein
VSLAAVLVGVGIAGVWPGGAALAETTYQPWSGYSQPQANQTSDQKLQKLVTDLNALIKKAEAAKAADPNFLADLKKLAAQYPVTPASQKGVVFLSDNFADGNYTTNPTWKVSAGAWSVDTKGQNIGLFSSIGQSTSNKVTGNDILKAILGVQEQQAPQSTYASIYTPATISSTFRMVMKLTSSSKSGPLNIGPYQGASGSSGYRLVYQPGKDTGIVLQRVVGNKITQVGAYYDPLNLEDGKVHELLWQRESTGKMRVYLDNQQLIIASDTELTGQFDGWLNVNQGGSYWIREIKVEGI